MVLPDWLVPPYWMFQLFDRLGGKDGIVHHSRQVFGVLAFIVLVSCGFAWTTVRDAQGLVEVRHIPALTDLPTTGPEPVLSIGTTIGGETVPEASSADGPKPGETYLIVGVDSRAGKDGQLGAGTAGDVVGVRSDTIALAHLSPNGVPKVVSIPRDTSVYRPDCPKWDPETENYDMAQVDPASDDVKINSAYAVGGPRCLVATIQQLTGIKVDKFIGVDFSGLIGIVDAVGGVTVKTPYALIDDELGTIVDCAGMHHLNGKKALAFARARKIAEEGRTDYGRIKRQQQLAGALVASVKEKIIASPSALQSLAQTFQRNIFGDNVSMDDILTQMTNLTGAQYQTVPTSGTNDNGNEVVDRVALGQMLQAIWGGRAN